MSLQEISFPSANGRDIVKAWSCNPDCSPRGVIQLMHGYGEHSLRYRYLIDKFQDAGFAVYADDHIGHGRTGLHNGTLGDPHSGGYMTYVEDERSLHDIAVSENPDIPYMIFGHSWGSMLARTYAAYYGDDIKGLMLSGLCSQWKGGEIEYKDPAFRAAVEADPSQPTGRWYKKVFLDMNERVEHPAGLTDWIANDPAVVAEHDADPLVLCNPALGFLWDVVQIYHFTESPEWAPMVPTDIPIYLTAGDQDPCGNYGEGLYHVANVLANSGHEVSVRAYHGYRHEIHQEPDLQGEVAADLIAFMDKVLA